MLCALNTSAPRFACAEGTPWDRQATARDAVSGERGFWIRDVGVRGGGLKDLELMMCGGRQELRSLFGVLF